MDEMKANFKVTFVRCGEGNCPYPVMCDFCQKNEAAWWCKFLMTGYCEQCMEEQCCEYERVMDKEMDDESKENIGEDIYEA